MNVTHGHHVANSNQKEYTLVSGTHVLTFYIYGVAVDKHTS